MTNGRVQSGVTRKSISETIPETIPEHSQVNILLNKLAITPLEEGVKSQNPFLF